MSIEHLLGKIHQGDCLEFMKQLPDKCVDLVLTDPPYGINLEYGQYKDTQENLKNMVLPLMEQILRISKRAMITPGINNVCLYPQPKWIIAWIYGTTNTWGGWGFNSWQPILTYGPDPYLENSMGARMDIIQDSHIPEKNGHPCPKSIQIWQKAINRGSVKNTDILFDPFMGSGTTAVACERLGRKWFGCELEPKYVEIANKRIEAERKQLKLF